MDTKLKKSRPFAAWLAFFIGLHLLVISAVGIIYYTFDYPRDASSSDYKDTSSFKQAISTNLYSILSSLSAVDYYYYYGNENILYFGKLENTKDAANQKVITNSNVKNFNEAVDYVQNHTKEYSYMLTWDGSTLALIDDNVKINPSQDMFYSNMLKALQDSEEYNLKDSRIVIGVKSSLRIRSGDIYYSYIRWIYIKSLLPLSVGAFMLGFLLLIISFVKKNSRREFSRLLGRLSGMLWLEVKTVITILLLAFTNDTGFIGLYFLFWWSYLMLQDLIVNKGRFFTNNSFSWVLGIYRSYEGKKDFQKAMLTRFILLIGVEAILIFLTFASMMSGSSAFMALIFIALGVFLFYIYFKGYSNIVTDIGKLVDQVEYIRSGDLDTKLALSENSILFRTGENLNHIQEGVQNALQDQLKSERMRIDLITNVSHDLKTPLTSIVNYIDLLSREKLEPDHANDYVKVLSKKALRLTNLTQDIFDISKAQSGNLEMHIERIDIVELIKQSLAELEEQIAAANLDFKVNLPQEKIYINADGRRLYRVFDNLISNILKYSLENTRVYVDLAETEDIVSLSMKNIAVHELNISPDDLMERFVRGDESRTTEGSGLGLAIVESFVSLCGGKFEIQIDGDLFKAIVSFSKALQD